MSHFQQLFFVKQVQKYLLEDKDNFDILEIGSYDVNGTIKNIFPQSNITGYDLIPGPNVDVVYDGKEIKSKEKFDISISCECFEHNPYYRENFLQMINLTKPSGLVIVTCASIGRLEHGTTRTDLSSPGSMEIFDYYKNLKPKDFGDKNFLDKNFSNYIFFRNYWTHDLYFVGQKHGSQKYDLDKFSELFIEFNSLVFISNNSFKKKSLIFFKKIILENILSRFMSDKSYRNLRIIIKKYFKKND